MIDIARAGKESLDLAMLFLEDQSGTALEKWFKGDIVKAEKTREAMHMMMNDGTSNPSPDGKELPIAKMLKHMYKIFSFYTHSGYGALLDSVDVFHEDLDFGRAAGFHYVYENLHVIHGFVVSIVIHLKHVFLKQRDGENFEAADRLYKSLEAATLTKKEMLSIFDRYRQDT